MTWPREQGTCSISPSTSFPDSMNECVLQWLTRSTESHGWVNSQPLSLSLSQIIILGSGYESDFYMPNCEQLNLLRDKRGPILSGKKSGRFRAFCTFGMELRKLTWHFWSRGVKTSFGKSKNIFRMFLVGTTRSWHDQDLISFRAHSFKNQFKQGHSSSREYIYLQKGLFVETYSTWFPYDI